jgi:hypothetical protein
MRNDEEFIPRPVRRSDFTVIFAGLIHNLASSFHTFTEEILEISIYHANQKTKTMQAWEDMSQDLEKIQEETDG